MYDLHLNLFVGPVPDLAPAVAIAIAAAIMGMVLVGGACMLALTISITGSFRKTGKLPETLMRFAEARQPLREHKHVHYSVAATEQMEREQQAAATGPIPLDEAGYEFFGIGGD